MSTSLDVARKKMTRWRILRILYTGRPLPVGEGLIGEVLSDADLAATLMEIRSALQYLSGKGYASYEEKRIPGDGVHWQASLTAHGVDFVEHQIPNDPGISRPAQV